MGLVSWSLWLIQWLAFRISVLILILFLITIIGALKDILPGKNALPEHLRIRLPWLDHPMTPSRPGKLRNQNQSSPSSSDSLQAISPWSRRQGRSSSGEREQKKLEAEREEPKVVKENIDPPETKEHKYSRKNSVDLTENVRDNAVQESDLHVGKNFRADKEFFPESEFELIMRLIREIKEGSPEAAPKVVLREMIESEKLRGSLQSFQRDILLAYLNSSSPLEKHAVESESVMLYNSIVKDTQSLSVENQEKENLSDSRKPALTLDVIGIPKGRRACKFQPDSPLEVSNFIANSEEQRKNLMNQIFMEQEFDDDVKKIVSESMQAIHERIRKKF